MIQITKTNIHLVLILIILMSLVAANNVKAQEPASVFFYNPEANIENMASLIRVFNSYFQPEISNFRIQPFVNVETFVNVSLQRKPAFLVTPYWNYMLLKKDISFSNAKIEAVITPTTDSQAYYKKIIVVRENSPFNNISDLQGQITSTSLGLQSLDFLNEFIFKNQADLSKLEFTWTTKDLDSLLALRFNQVQIAIVNEKTFEEVKATRPNMVAGLKIIATSEDIPQAVLVRLNNNIDAGIADKIQNLFLEMNNSSSGNEILNLLGYDKWIKLAE